MGGQPSDFARLEASWSRNRKAIALRSRTALKVAEPSWGVQGVELGKICFRSRRT